MSPNAAAPNLGSGWTDPHNLKKLDRSQPTPRNDTVLQTEFSRYGTIVSASVMYDKQTKESRGFGFVTYACAAASFVVRGNLFWFRN